MEFHRVGQNGELVAANYLVAQGYEIVDANYFNNQGYRVGELDIVARNRDNKLIFVEVKARKGEKDKVVPEENLTRSKIYKIIRAINHYLRKNDLIDQDWRLDLITVIFDYRIRKMTLRHIKGIRL